MVCTRRGPISTTLNILLLPDHPECLFWTASAFWTLSCVISYTVYFIIFSLKLFGPSLSITVTFHPELPIILTGSEDGTVRIWHANTYRLENTLNYGLERVWTITCLKGSNNVALGYDEGSILVKLGREEPAMSMDTSGKLVWAKHSEIQQANIKTIVDQSEIKDGERLTLSIKDMGSCEIFPQTISHNPNGRRVYVLKQRPNPSEIFRLPTFLWQKKLHN